MHTLCESFYHLLCPNTEPDIPGISSDAESTGSDKPVAENGENQEENADASPVETEDAAEQDTAVEGNRVFLGSIGILEFFCKFELFMTPWGFLNILNMRIFPHQLL